MNTHIYILFLSLSLSVLHPEGSAKAAQTKGAATLGWAVQTHYTDTYEQTYIQIYIYIYANIKISHSYFLYVYIHISCIIL